MPRRYRPYSYRATQKLVKALELALRYLRSVQSRATDDACIPETMQAIEQSLTLIGNALRAENRTRGIYEPEPQPVQWSALVDSGLPPESSDAPEIPPQEDHAWPAASL